MREEIEEWDQRQGLRKIWMHIQYTHKFSRDKVSYSLTYSTETAFFVSFTMLLAVRAAVTVIPKKSSKLSES